MPFDVLVRNGRVLDGTGTPWRVLDLGVRRGRIAQVGRLNRSKASVVIDAAGKYVAPGFIDIHTHSDIGILAEPTCECAVRQGVTTHVIGNCGDSPAPISDGYGAPLRRRGEAVRRVRGGPGPLLPARLLRVDGGGRRPRPGPGPPRRLLRVP